jgi:hypothetical protein
MSKRYSPIRFPTEAYLNFQVKQKNMEQMVRQMTGKNVRIPMTQVIIAASEIPINVSDAYLNKFIKRRKIKR